MDLYESIEKRRNVHNFKEQNVPLSTLKKILKAGTLASSAFNGQPWEFIVVTDKKVCNALSQYKYDHNMQGLLASNVPREEADKMAGLQRDAFTNSVPVVVIYNKNSPVPSESTWNCITTIWLSATAEGLGMSPAFFGLHAQGPIKEMLEIPEDYDIAAIIRIGIPEVIPDAKSRKPIEECLYENRFGSLAKI